MLTALRTAHFPPERNWLDAHLTLFHHLPPSILPELKVRLAAAANAPPSSARLAGIMNLGRGTALRIESPGLEAVRDDLAQAFRGLLTPQDSAAWRPHVTIQNKVAPAEARALQAALAGRGLEGPVRIGALGLWHYRDGPWEAAARYPFRG